MQQETRKTSLTELAATAPTDADGFLRWTSHRKREEGKFELSRGQVTCALINVSRAHARVCTNILIGLGRLMDHDHFDLSAADFAVRTKVGVRSPDIVIDRTQPNGRELSTSAPIFIAEVLSPSTAGTDFTAKLEEYASIDTLQTYLICAQEEPRAWVWARQVDGTWPKLPVELAGRDGVITLGDLEVELAMAAIFRGISNSPTAE